MAKNNLRVNTKRDKMIKYVTIHNVYLMNVLNKLCFDLFGGLNRGSRQPVSDCFTL